MLLREALKRAKKSGLATFVMKDKEHIALIHPEGNALTLIQLRYEDEIRPIDELHIPKTADYSKKEIDISLALINQLTDHFKADEYHDTYTEQLEKIISQKAKGKPIHVAKEAEPVPTDMRYLMDILKESLEKAKTSH